MAQTQAEKDQQAKKARQDYIDACVKLHDEKYDEFTSVGHALGQRLIAEYERSKTCPDELVAEFEDLKPMERVSAWSFCTKGGASPKELEMAKYFHSKLANLVLDAFGAELMVNDDNPQRMLLVGMQHTKRHSR